MKLALKFGISSLINICWKRDANINFCSNIRLSKTFLTDRSSSNLLSVNNSSKHQNSWNIIQTPVYKTIWSTLCPMLITSIFHVLHFARMQEIFSIRNTDIIKQNNHRVNGNFTKISTTHFIVWTLSSFCKKTSWKANVLQWEIEQCKRIR